MGTIPTYSTLVETGLRSHWVAITSAKNTYRHRDLGQLFANAVLHDAPQVERVVRFVRNACPPLL